MKYSFLLILLVSMLACKSQTPPNEKLQQRISAILGERWYDNTLVELDMPDYVKWKPDKYYKGDRLSIGYVSYEVKADSTETKPGKHAADWEQIEGPHPYLFLRDTATTEELKELLKSEHDVIKTFAFAALHYRHEKGLWDVLLENMSDTTRFRAASRSSASTYSRLNWLCPADMMIRYMMKELNESEKEKLITLVNTRYPHLEFTRKALILSYGKKALFTADTTQLFDRSGRNKSHYQDVLQMEWKIKGKTLRFGSASIELDISDNSIDTLYYKVHQQAKWDTIIYNLTDSKEYRFTYNVCCGGFNVETDTREMQAYVSYRLTKMNKDRLFLGTLGEMGTRVTSKFKTLKPGCRSAMSPNIYWLTLQEVKKCSGQKDCESLMCEQRGDQIEDGFEYKVVSSVFSVLYMPLNTKTLEITLDVYTRKFVTEIK